jgi:hypothetical protein
LPAKGAALAGAPGEGMDGPTQIDAVLTAACWAVAAVLIALRLTGAVHWSWWWITAPVWLPIVVVAGGLAVSAALRRFKHKS